MRNQFRPVEESHRKPIGVFRLIGVTALGLSYLSGCSALQHAYMEEAFACADPLSIECTVARQESSEERRRLESQRRSEEYSGPRDSDEYATNPIPSNPDAKFLLRAWEISEHSAATPPSDGERFLRTNLQQFLCNVVKPGERAPLSFFDQYNPKPGSQNSFEYETDEFHGSLTWSTMGWSAQISLSPKDGDWPFTGAEMNNWLSSIGFDVLQTHAIEISGVANYRRGDVLDIYSYEISVISYRNATGRPTFIIMNWVPRNPSGKKYLCGE